MGDKRIAVSLYTQTSRTFSFLVLEIFLASVLFNQFLQPEILFRMIFCRIIFLKQFLFLVIFSDYVVFLEISTNYTQKMTMQRGKINLLMSMHDLK